MLLKSYEEDIKQTSLGKNNHNIFFGDFTGTSHQNVKKLAQLFHPYTSAIRCARLQETVSMHNYSLENQKRTIIFICYHFKRLDLVYSGGRSSVPPIKDSI